MSPRPPSHDPDADARFWAGYDAIAQVYRAHFDAAGKEGRVAAAFSPAGVRRAGGVVVRRMTHSLAASATTLEIEVAGDARLWPVLRRELPMGWRLDPIPGGIGITCRVPALNVHAPFDGQAADVRHAMSCLWRFAAWWRSSLRHWEAWIAEAGGAPPVVVHDIRRIPAHHTWGLRQSILRPTMAVSEMQFPNDDAPGAAHFGAYRVEEIVGVVSIAPSPFPAPDSRPALVTPATALEPAWQLRGMATAPAVRGEGHGAALVAACVRHVTIQEAALLWCNARVGAAKFYERLGWIVVSGEFDIPTAGPHVVMWRPIRNATVRERSGER